MATTLDLLAAQIAIHDRYSEDALDLRADVRAAMALSGDERILDIGCGTGEMLLSIRETGHRGQLMGVDIRQDAVDATASHLGIGACVGDAAAVPLPDRSMDRTVMMHMLYYLRDPAAGLTEMRRLTRPGGRVVLSLNHLITAPRIRALVVEAAGEVGYRARTASQVWANLPTDEDLDAGTATELIRNEFGHVELVQRVSALVFPSPEAVMEHAKVIAQFTCDVPDDPAVLDTVLAPVQQQVRAQFDRDAGPWRDPKGYTVFSAEVD